MISTKQTKYYPFRPNLLYGNILLADIRKSSQKEQNKVSIVHFRKFPLVFLSHFFFCQRCLLGCREKKCGPHL